MAKESSFDVVSEFDFQELRNAVDKTQKEVATRYDFKGAFVEIDLQENVLVLKTEDEMKLSQLRDMVIKNIISRKLNPKILKFNDPEGSLGGNMRQEATLIKALDSDTVKKISKMIRDEFKKTVKPTIQGDSIRVASKNRDDLQAVQRFLREREDLEVPLVFNNYR